MPLDSIPSNPDSPVRDRILEVARDMFRTQGYNGTKTRQLAKAAGTSETGLFRHFQNKYTLLTAVYDDSWRQVNVWIDQCLRDHQPFQDPRDELAQIILSLWRFYEHDPDTSAFLIINTGNTDSLLVDHQDQATISNANVEYLDRIQRLCDAAATAGLLGHVTARALAEGLYGLSEGVLLGWYLYDKVEAGRYEQFPKISIEEALTLLQKLLR